MKGRLTPACARLPASARAGANLSAAAAIVLALLAGCDGDSDNTGNHRPSAPVIEPPADVKVSTPAEFRVTVYDPDGDQLRVYVAWGDGDTSDYGEFVPSFATVLFLHTYRAAGTYLVSGRCHENRTTPLFSDWSVPDTVVCRAP